MQLALIELQRLFGKFNLIALELGRYTANAARPKLLLAYAMPDLHAYAETSRRAAVYLTVKIMTF